MAGPQDFARRSPLARTLESEGAPWRALADAAIADAPDPGGAAARLSLADLSPLPRLGFKGRGTIPAMRARGLALDSEPNRVFRQDDGTLCLVLAASEVVLLGDLSGEGTRLAGLEAAFDIEAGEATYPVPRRDASAWIAVTGAMAPTMLSTVCGVDLRTHRFADLAIAQTSVVRLNAVVARVDIGATPVFHLLADSASAAYFFSCLRDAATALGGGIVGVGALQDLGRG